MMQIYIYSAVVITQNTLFTALAYALDLPCLLSYQLKFRRITTLAKIVSIPFHWYRIRLHIDDALVLSNLPPRRMGMALITFQFN